MTYRVILTPEARGRSAHSVSLYSRACTPCAASEWLRRARQSIRTLSHYPECCPLAPESASFDEPIRELLFGAGNRGAYRFLFVVAGRTVFILHIRHGSRLSLDPEE